ncbi:hypothetical protein BUE93_05780 [Chromobacterium amazonense]|uniref:Phage tail protein n=1 Tax=Chromobacterium amazonense TaxID=1382803 RepID=A0A2S9X735_9NEIS|nr:phage tail protein [Chromobacterium amazonense]PRP71507.1 hypothetical protein BUE93_05780 [Chromobacterium amazonense]
MAETFNWTPDFGGQKTFKPRLRTARFGDGYAQQVPDGINHLPQNRSLIFTNRSPQESDAIEAFLERHAGCRWFWLVYPGEPRMKATCAEWSRVHVAPGLYSISANFEQSFAPGE